MAISAVLLYQGHALQLADVTVLTEMWISGNLRPDITGTYLPNLGDSPLAANLIASQTALTQAGSLSSVLPALHCKSITEQEYIEGSVRGTIYTVQYDDTPADWTVDPVANGTVILNISSGSEVVTFYPRKDGPSAGYVFTDDGTQVEDIPITKVIGVTNVSTTKRVRSKTANQIIALGEKTGKLNNVSMWGQGIGNILFTGTQTVPVQEYEKLSSTKSISWNVTNNYQIKYIPGVTEDTWQKAWVNAKWTFLYTDDAQTTRYELYDYDTIPNDLI